MPELNSNTNRHDYHNTEWLSIWGERFDAALKCVIPISDKAIERFLCLDETDRAAEERNNKKRV